MGSGTREYEEREEILINQKKKIGIVGRSFGKVVFDELSAIHEITWQVGAKQYLKNLAEVDIVYLASPTEFHFEHAKFFLQRKIAVIVEKPPTLSVGALTELINVAINNGTFVYFSDIFRFRSDIVNRLDTLETVQWSKTNNTNDWVASRFAYHYLYLLIDYIDLEENIDVVKCNKDELIINLPIKGRNVKLEFNQDAKQNFHKINNRIVPAGVAGPIAMMVSPKNLTKLSIQNNNQKAILVMKLFEKLRQSMPKVNVVGGGIFGSQTAITLAKSGLNVTLYEKNHELITQASAINQYRVHLGYHYPRSKETVAECRKSFFEFQSAFSPAMITENEAYYAIATSQSKVTAEDYKGFLDEMDLKYQVVKTINNCDLTLKVDEPLYSPSILKNLIIDRLKSLGVIVRLGVTYKVDESTPDKTLTIFATYSNSGTFDGATYQHEICEKPIVRLPKKYRQKGYVIMDGPFMCMDPFERTGLHVMGNVVHALHHKNDGTSPVIPKKYENLINKGMIKSENISNVTKFEHFKNDYKKFFDGVDDIEHVGSMFTVRSVLPNRDHDDARPTEVRWIGSQKILIFSGKVVTCVSAADHVLQMSWKALNLKRLK